MQRNVRMKNLLVPLVGFATGLVNGLLGIGGGTLLLPALVFLFGVEQHRAHGTSISTVLPTSAVSVLVYGSNQLLEWDLIWKVSAGGIVGAFIGASVLGHFSAIALRRLYAMVIFLIGLRLVAGAFL